MARQSTQLEHEVEHARASLEFSINALRERLTPGQIAEEVLDYARATPVAEFARNAGREVQANPLPLIVIFAGIAWAFAATAFYSSRRVRRIEPQDATAAMPQPASEEAALHEGWGVERVSEPVE